MKKRKSPPKDVLDFLLALPPAMQKADAERRGQTVKEARHAICEHWPRAACAMKNLLDQGDNEWVEILLTHYIQDLLDVFGQTGQRRILGPAVFRAAKKLTRAVVGLCATQYSPPAWLAEKAATEYEVPWLMVNGKPAPGFAEADAQLHWGHAIIKRGKSQFVTPQTRTVAEELSFIDELRNVHQSSMGELIGNFLPGLPAEAKEISTLPPLSRKTRTQWWPVVRAFIRHKNKYLAKGWGCLSKKQISNIRASLEYKTDAELMNEFLKRCKVAFDGLCPSETPGKKLKNGGVAL